MPHPIEQKVARLRRRVRRLVTVRAIGLVVGWVLAAVVLLGLADYAIRFEDVGLRLLSLSLLVAAAGWSLYHYMWQPLRRQPTELSLAQRVEQKFPDLAGHLGVSLEFLRQKESDPFAGSTALRRAVVTRTAAASETLDFAEVLDPRPLRRALIGALVVSVVASALVILEPASARCALVRLLKPLGSERWPKRNELVFRKPPARIAAGDSFEVELVDRRGRLPEEAKIFFRGADGIEQAEAMRLVGDRFVARKDSVTRSFSFRAEGGDDRQMPWLDVDVVTPPQIESSTITLYPPEYTGWPPQKCERNVKALVGTRVAVQARTNKPLGGARLRTESGASVPAQLLAGANGFLLSHRGAEPWTIDKNGTYWFELVDRQGVHGGRQDRWPIRAVSDNTPTVTIDEPKADIFVTHAATVPLKIIARDDLALEEVALSYSRSDRSDVQSFAVSLVKGPKKATALIGSDPWQAITSADEQTVSHAWSLSELQLAPGTTVSFYGTATDYRPQTGKSLARRLVVITRDQLDDRIAERQALVLAELNRALGLERECRGGVMSLKIQLEKVGRLEKSDLDQLQVAQQNQRQIARTLASGAEGIQPLVADLLSELAMNKVDNPDLKRRMQSIQAELKRLSREHLGPIDQQLVRAIKDAQLDTPSPASTDPKPPRTVEAIASAAGHQDKVIGSLESMLGELSQWDSYRRFARELGQLRREQDTILAGTQALAPRTLGKEVANLPAQEQADLAKLTEREAVLSRTFEKVRAQMESMLSTARPAEPLAADALADAVEVARRKAPDASMRSAAEQLERNQMGQAVHHQKSTLASLDELIDILAQRREHELSRLVKKLREAETQLAELERKQQGLRKKLAAAAADADAGAKRRQLEALKAQQQQLKTETQRLARQLERLEAASAAASTSSAAARMNQAERGLGEEASPKPSEEAGRAVEQLRKAKQQLAEHRREIEAQLAREQLARLEDAVQRLRQRQEGLLAEARRLHDLKVAQGQWSRGETTSVNQAAGAQQALEEEAGELAEKLVGAEVFKLAIDAAKTSMARAAGRLKRHDASPATQSAQQGAIKRLDQIAKAFQARKDAAPKENNSSSGGEGGASGAEQQELHTLAELKLLKIMQEDLNQRFKSQHEANSGPSEDQASSLAKEQSQLADIALRLAQPPAEAPEDDPESLPDVRLDGK